MKDLKKIRNLDDKIFSEFTKYYPKVKKSKFEKKYPITNQLVDLFDTSSTFIKNGIFDGCSTDNYYGIKILYRSQIEHYLKFKYLFFNFVKSKTDLFAQGFFDYLNAREILDKIKADVSGYQLIDSNYRIKDWNALLQKYSKFPIKNRKDFHEQTKKYSIKKIISFLNNELKKDNSSSEFFCKIISEYSVLSSFVHGGMESYQEMAAANTSKERSNEYIRICSLSYQMSNSIKLFRLLMLLSTDREMFESHYIITDKLLRKIEK